MKGNSTDKRDANSKRCLVMIVARKIARKKVPKQNLVWFYVPCLHYVSRACCASTSHRNHFQCYQRSKGRALTTYEYRTIHGQTASTLSNHVEIHHADVYLDTIEGFSSVHSCSVYLSQYLISLACEEPKQSSLLSNRIHTGKVYGSMCPHGMSNEQPLTTRL